jgi:ankyrin repeat protein
MSSRYTKGLLEAVRFNHLEIIEMLLKKKVDVHRDVADGDGWGALHIACYYGGSDAMEMLLAAGIQIEARGGADNAGTTALM